MGTVMYDPKTDERWQNPVIDEEKMMKRTLSDGREIDFKYVHVKFEGTNLKCVVCLPQADVYEGRFQHYLSPFPGPDEEVASIARTGYSDKLASAFEAGAYFVESNMASEFQFGAAADSTLTWKSSAAAAEYSRVVAMEYYGTDKRPYGYVYGGSGGGYKTMSCIENCTAWDGACPFVIGSPMSLPNTITMHVQGMRVLRNVFEKIVDDLDAGGSGDPYAGLTKFESDMLLELTRMGFPPQAWYLEAWGIRDAGSFPVLAPGVKTADPTYFTDFWTVPGYAGADSESSSVADRFVLDGKVVEVQLPGQEEEKSAIGLNGVDDAWKKQLVSGNGAWIRIDTCPEKDVKDLYIEGTDITFTSGSSVGKKLGLDTIIKTDDGGCILVIGMSFGSDDPATALAELKAGDGVHIDNSDYVAMQSYYRHQVPADTSFHAWDQFRKEDGTPAIPQRAFCMGPGFTGTGMPQDGNIQGKVINIQALMDESTCPWCGDWYRNKIIETKGSDKDHRIYYMQRCMHGDTDSRNNYMVVEYLGALRQALIDVAAWVEKGIEPTPSTSYRMDENNQVVLNPDMKERFGYQADVLLTANGAKKAVVKAGEEVTLEVKVILPVNAGDVTSIRLQPITNKNPHFEMAIADMYPYDLEIEHLEEDGLKCGKASMKFTYDQPGEYFAAVRIQTNREGKIGEIYTQVLNLDRARIVVE